MRLLSLFRTALLALLLQASLTAGDRPNILWIFVEDLSPYMGCYGDPINAGHTPTIDRLAAEGVLFRRTFMPAPVCSPCRSAIITGVMQTTAGTHQHRSSRAQTGPVPEALRIALPAGIATVPERMREAGYFTFNSGKDDYNFHYDRRALYSVGTKPNYRHGTNGWQGNSSQHAGSFTEHNWSSRPDKSQPWFGQIMLWGGKAGGKHVREGDSMASTCSPRITSHVRTSFRRATAVTTPSIAYARCGPIASATSATISPTGRCYKPSTATTPGQSRI